MVQSTGIQVGYFGVKDSCEMLAIQPRLLVSRSCDIGRLRVVDVQGTLATLASGQRTVTGANVWLYTDAVGRAMPPSPVLTAEWPFKLQIQ